MASEQLENRSQGDEHEMNQQRARSPSSICASLLLIALMLQSSGCTAIRNRVIDASNASSKTLSLPRVIKDRLRISAVQYPIEGGKTAAKIFAKMESYIEEAKRGDADLIVFPELITLDAWPLASTETDDVIAQNIARDITPALIEQAKRWSHAYGAAILAGTSPRIVHGKIRNTAVLAFPNGNIVTQDKVYLTAWERKLGWEHGTKIDVFDAPWGRTAILICYDSEFPGLSHSLAKQAPSLLLIPSMTESKSGLERIRWAAQARAVEHHAYVIISSNVGNPEKNWQMYGQSAYISPRDSLFLEDPVSIEEGKAGALSAELDLAKLRESRKTSTFYPAADEAKRSDRASP